MQQGAGLDADWCDSREIDRLADAVLDVIAANPPAAPAIDERAAFEKWQHDCLFADNPLPTTNWDAWQFRSGYPPIQAAQAKDAA